MTFPFSGKFKFILLKSMREDDMTSSTIKNLNGVLQFNSFKYLHLLLYFSSPRNTPKKINSCKQERAEENDPPKSGAFLKIFEPRKNQSFYLKIICKKK